MHESNPIQSNPCHGAPRHSLIPDRCCQPEFTALFDIIDPYSYLGRYDGLPKLVGDATGVNSLVLEEIRSSV